MKTRIAEIVIGLALVVVVVSAFAQTWVRSSITYRSDWEVDCSADGKIICAVASGSAPVVSKDYGKTWKTNTTMLGAGAPNVLSVAADGRTMVGALNSNLSSGLIYISTNSGDSWFRAVSNVVSCTACSADGSRIIAGNANGAIYVSTNAGATWRTNTTGKDWQALACPGSGQVYIGAAWSDKIYFSTNDGVTWNATASLAKIWYGIASSANGIRLAALASDALYLSSDGGVTWTTNTGVTGNSVASSADGAKLIVVGSRVYLSDDYGTTWRNGGSTSAFYTGSASSADGCRFAIAANFSSQPGIWLAQTNPSPQLSLGSFGSNMLVAWTVPSTNFVLQQNSDIGTANWTAVTNAPSLDYTNIQYEVSLPISDTSGFFRLISQ